MDKHTIDKDEIKKKVLERIRAGDNFKQTRKFLENEGIHYTGLKTTFYTWKNEIIPEEQRQDALASIAEKREKTKQPLLPTPKAWTKQKQKESDECVFADVLNEAFFAFIPCPEKNLKIEDIKEINLGGGIVGIVTYYTSINLNHPVIVVITRAVLLILKVRKMCYMINEKIAAARDKAQSILPGQGSVGSMQ